MRRQIEGLAGRPRVSRGTTRRCLRGLPGLRDHSHVPGRHVIRDALLALVVLPLAGLDGAGDEDPVALLDVLGEGFGLPLPCGDAPPVGAFLDPLAVLSAVVVVGDGEAEDGFTVVRVLEVVDAADVADDLDVCHVCSVVLSGGVGVDEGVGAAAGAVPGGVAVVAVHVAARLTTGAHSRAAAGGGPVVALQGDDRGGAGRGGGGCSDGGDGDLCGVAVVACFAESDVDALGVPVRPERVDERCEGLCLSLVELRHHHRAAARGRFEPSRVTERNDDDEGKGEGGRGVASGFADGFSEPFVEPFGKGVAWSSSRSSGEVSMRPCHRRASGISCRRRASSTRIAALRCSEWTRLYALTRAFVTLGCLRSPSWRT